MDAVLLSRIQFAFTIAFHFLFVPLSLGTAIALVIGERRFYKSGSLQDEANARFWVQALHRHVRDRRRDRHHDGVRLRHQLGDLFPLRRRHLRRSPGRRGPALVLPGIDLPGGVALRAGPCLAPLLLRLGVVGGHRRPPVGPVDHHRQLVAADTGRLRGGRRAGGAHRLLRRRPQPLHPAPLLPHGRSHLDGRCVLRRRHRRLLSAQGSPHRLRPADAAFRPGLRSGDVGGHALPRPLVGPDR